MNRGELMVKLAMQATKAVNAAGTWNEVTQLYINFKKINNNIIEKGVDDAETTYIASSSIDNDDRIRDPNYDATKNLNVEKVLRIQKWLDDSCSTKSSSTIEFATNPEVQGLSPTIPFDPIGLGTILIDSNEDLLTATEETAIAEAAPVTVPATKEKFDNETSDNLQVLEKDTTYIASSSIDNDDSICDPDYDVKKDLNVEKVLRIQKWLDDSCSSSSTVEFATNPEVKGLSPTIPFDPMRLSTIRIDNNEVLLTATAETVIEKTAPVTVLGVKEKIDNETSDNLQVLEKNTTLKTPNELYKSPFLNSNKYKKTICKFCDDHIISRHFARHLERRHLKEIGVKEIFDQPTNSLERKRLLSILRNEGNLDSALRGDVIPKRRDANAASSSSLYEICSQCKAYFKRSALSRHTKKCFLNVNTEEGRALSKSQLFTISIGTYGQFLSKLNVKNQVFSIMKNDDISKTAQKDPLICLYGENLLKKHRRQQMATVISNKLRECGRFLIEMRKLGKFDTLLSILKPGHFDTVITAVKMMSGYQENNKTYKAPSLAMHIGTTLKQISELAIKLVLRNNPILEVQNTEETLSNLNRFKEIVTSQWTVEISSLAMKDLTEKASMKPRLLPVTEDIKKLRNYTFKHAENAYNNLKTRMQAKFYKILVETVLVLVIIHNRKRVGDIQYLELVSYKKQINIIHSDHTEFTNSLSESEKILTKHYKRITTIGKGSKSVTVLIPKKLQKFFTLLVDIRENSTIVPSTNKYLFSYPESSRWINGCVAIRKYAKLCGAKNPELITSSRLRKHIATVTQLLNLKQNEIDQLANFMGHTKKTHETFYKLPEDIYQVAKVSKVLQLMEQGKAGNFQNKSLEEINIDVNSVMEDDQSSVSENETEKVLHTDKTSTGVDNVSNNSSSTESSEKKKTSQKTKEKKKITHAKNKFSCRQKWSDEEVTVIKKHFAKFIRQKRAPKKQDVEEVIKQNPNLFSKRNWVTIKAYVYNCYRDR